ncbi:unnamed protein product [Periconia digitata]|uniref:Peptidase C14 caspase domain-containing protein n=1 Tax=Periconia digitata TaxID=1303443 RepID=A0A9W4ULU2_9PLEO|nr:unnamed protein product [Periconia digitata]
MADHDPSLCRYALLIGIDDYSERPLKGCVRDVHEIKNYLDGMSKPRVHTHLLTASSIKDSALSSGTTALELLPTYQNVVDTLEKITLQAKAEDFVYIHFSGHGTAFRPSRDKSLSKATNPSTGDLALNLLQEEDNRQIRYLRGFELAHKLRNMVDKGLQVTLVLDCCFAGSIMRDAVTRYLDYDARADTACPPDSKGALSLVHEVEKNVYRKPSLWPNWLVNPDGYTVITACGPTETAKEILIDGQRHGALTYYLTEVFKKYGGIGGKQRYIHQALRARIRDAREKYNLDQNPMMYGNRDLYFFGCINPRIGPAPITATRTRDGELRLDAGEAHGIRKGDTFALCAEISATSSGLDMAPQRVVGTAEVVLVRALTSELDSSGESIVGGRLIAATALTRHLLHEAPVRIDLGDNNPEGWKEALEGREFLDTSGVRKEEPGPNASFGVKLIGSSHYEIRDGVDRPLLHLPVASSVDEESAERVSQIAEHLARFDSVKRLTKLHQTESERCFEESFSAHLIKPGGLIVQRGCLHTDSSEPACSHSECLIEVEEGQSISLEVRNKEKAGGHALCLHLYNLGSSWDITNLLKTDYVVIPPSSSNQSGEFMKGTSGVWNKAMKMTIPSRHRESGEKHEDDIIKLFVTSQPTSLASLELPELETVLERNASRKTKSGVTSRNNTSVFSESENWATLSFRIRTKAKLVS